jgi:hypothetical protein
VGFIFGGFNYLFIWRKGLARICEGHDLRAEGINTIRPSLRDWRVFGVDPSVETLGYYRAVPAGLDASPMVRLLGYYRGGPAGLDERLHKESGN